MHSHSPEHLTPPADPAFPIPYSALTKGKLLRDSELSPLHQGKYRLGGDVINVAIKRHPIPETKKELEELKSKSALVSQLEHPNLIRYFGLCLEPENGYSHVMELMPQNSLHTFLQNKKNDASWDTSWKIRARIALDVASGLAYLHEHGIIHGNISSDTIFLGPEHRAKISTLRLFRSQSVGYLTAVSQVKSSPHWNAPESIQHNTGYIHRKPIFIALRWYYGH